MPHICTFDRESCYSKVFLVINGYYDLNPLVFWDCAKVDWYEEVKSERERETARWTPAFWRKTFPEAFPNTEMFLTKRLDKEEVRAKCDMLRLYQTLFPEKKEPRYPNRRYVQVSCPFHGEDRLPSLSLDTELKRYTCHACGERGDAFDMIMKALGVDFSKAVEEADRIC